MKFPVFATAIQKCDSVLRPYGILLTDILTSDNKNISDNIINFLLGLVGLQVKKLFRLNVIYGTCHIKIVLTFYVTILFVI